MIHFSEAVLPGHPDKFCDHIADAIVAEAMAADPFAFAQIEVGIWSDEAWLSGNIVTRTPLKRMPKEILVQTGLSIGLNSTNQVDATRYRITDTVCRNIDDPTEGRNICDDQAIVIGYAGYDTKTRYLPPEHFMVHALTEHLWRECQLGLLKGCGPDGKVLISMREEHRAWTLETILVTLQQPSGYSLLDLTQRIHLSMKNAYSTLQGIDERWTVDWADVDVLVNPNGPHLRGGSHGDNGQTGRKLVMDYYGPRIPLGGGALSGKHPAHIDRLAAKAARRAAVYAVQTGARDCTIRLAYAPNRNIPIQEVWEINGRGERQPKDYFNFDNMLRVMEPGLPVSDRGTGIRAWQLPGKPHSSQLRPNQSKAGALT